MSDSCEPHPAEEVFNLLGERWNNAILREVYWGVHRFGALQRSLGIGPNTLTSRLATLVELGLLERHRYRPDKDWYDYRLTDSARQLVPAWIALTQWGRTHLHPGGSDRRRIRHTGCGELVNPQLTCDHCGEVLTGHDLEPIELSDEKAATTARTRR
ncbi:helix-turn-helix transcriptional regulator [Nocardia sp. CA2R105]|uniref:winged helix-turn-helix transcriptional regulator n=1 Tax=Nocardia coffeae TaxID=2873381 RepID=UPI001CA722DA|nr:helix-turn-helix domain-containing protein [Nocardia coffeae]MBY8862629.1 helix-turn-helix transcriptional regulator [Nocardia coffeae]